MLALAGLLLSMGAGTGWAASPPPAADTVFLDGNVITMDTAKPKARAVAVKNGKILAIGTNAEIQDYVASGTRTVRLDGATVLPGFIDPHSHFLGYAFFTDERNWIDVSTMNLFYKPLPGDPECKDPDDPQKCFIPVKSQDDVVDRITAAARKRGVTRVLAMNYDPSRLGHGESCKGPATNVGFACPNFENGTARATLDAISKDIPVFVSSQTGHISYANSVALYQLNICGVTFPKGWRPPAGIKPPTKPCLAASINPTQETALAQKGQLNEDLALYSDAYWIGQVLEGDKLAAPRAINRAVDIYAGQGYTLVQEGAASKGDASIYLDLMKDDKNFPLTVAMMMYDATSPNFANTIAAADAVKAEIKGQRNLFVSGVKSFADGSVQGYTSFMEQPFYKIFPPYSLPPFPQPYQGLPDLWEGQMAQRVDQAHAAGYPIMIHENGDAATEKAVAALRKTHYPNGRNFRDIVLHAPFIDKQTLSWVKDINDPISFMMPNLHFWALPLCQQVLGPSIMNGRYVPYPAKTALSMGLRVTMHTDSPVNAPDPLFTVWVAKTRKVQQIPWYPNTNPKACPAVLGPNEAISIEQGLRAFTIDAAWQYGLSASRGSITPGKVADMVVMSKDPLSMESSPDRLRDVRVVGTVHNGTYRLNPLRLTKRIWPGDL